MSTNSSASVRVETPHETEATQTTISDVLRRRAQEVANDTSIDPRWQTIIRNALDLNDPWLADLVRRADAGEMIIDTNDFSETPDTSEYYSTLEALADIICGGGDKPTAALFVLMGMMQESDEPTAAAYTIKHFAFTRCGEWNAFGMVDAQVAVVRSQLLARNTPVF